MSVPGITYVPPPTISQFLRDSSSLVRCVVGPVGSGKSMGVIMELFRRSCQQAAHNGVRRSRWALVRNTLQQLKATVLNDVLLYLGPLVRHHVSDSKIILDFPLGDGTKVEAEWLLVPLDRPEDQQRLLSLQLTGAWVNEAREVPIDILMALIGRCGRYPSKLLGGPSWYGVVLDTNPWSVASPYHETFVLEPRTGWTLYQQPGGLAPDAENVENLPAGYYENLSNGRDPEWVRVHVHGEWGDDLSGQAVFRRSFLPQLHVVDLPDPTINPFRPIMVALDFGRTPTALITQMGNDGCLWFLDEVTTEDMGLRQMVRERLKPLLFSEPYGGRRAFIIADPAGSQKSQLAEENAFDVLRDEGFMAYPAPTNEVAKRLLALEKLLMSANGLRISRQRCPRLVRAMSSEYKYRRKRTGDLDDMPEKTHPWSDLADCAQYAALGVNGNYTALDLRRTVRAQPQRAPVSAAGWT
ncbi:MAG: terminase [Betaproteobacteria bacterium]|jgi:hypothetical protein|nr:terminase [Betaproteobacteria bacterium]